MAASRIADAFRLELRLEAPLHEEERAIREFVRWASDTVEIGDSSTEAPIPVFLDLLRAARPSGGVVAGDGVALVRVGCVMRGRRGRGVARRRAPSR